MKTPWALICLLVTAIPLRTSHAAEPEVKYEEHFVYDKEDAPAFMECYQFALARNEAAKGCANRYMFSKHAQDDIRRCELKRVGTLMEKNGYNPTGTKRDERTCRRFRTDGEVAERRRRMSTAEDVALAWEARAPRKHMAEKNTLLAILSREYREAKDEFARKDMEDDLFATLRKTLSLMRKKRRMILTMDVKLGEYDFEKQGFPVAPLGFQQELSPHYLVETGSYRHQSYYVEFANPKAVSFIRVAEKTAREMRTLLNVNQRRAELVLHCDVVRARFDSPPWTLRTFRHLVVRMKRAELNIIERDNGWNLLFLWGDLADPA